MTSTIGVETHIVINDIHVPFHDKEVFEAFFQFCKDFQPDVVHINGDFIDFPQISKYDKDPNRLLQLQDDIDIGVELLEEIRKYNPKAKIIFHDGNHEARLYKYKWSHPELARLRDFCVPKLLQFERFDISYLKYDQPFIWKKTFVITHGSVARKHSAYSAKAELENWGLSGMSGHTHRLSAHYKTDRAGQRVWFENGCMCMKEKVDYMNGTPNWQHGFSIIFFKKNSKRFYVQQVPIVDKGFIFNNKQYGK